MTTLSSVVALAALGGIREILGSRTLLGMQVLPDAFEPWLIMILPAGAFLTLGLMMGFLNSLVERKKRREEEAILKKHMIAAPVAAIGGEEA